MKLVEIKDVRVGQVWKHNKTGLLHTIDDLSLLRPIIQAEFIARRNDYLKECSLIGFLGITHEIKDEQLVEIPRAEFEVDNIIKQFGKTFVILGELANGNIKAFTGKHITNFYPKGSIIGILGVTHEFINERLVK